MQKGKNHVKSKTFEKTIYKHLKTRNVCETLMPPKHQSFEKHEPDIYTLTFADDFDLGTSRCVSMRCAFIPNMSFVTK